MTRIKVAYGYNRRSIDLGSGEAMFKVAHERSRPFVVKTRLGSFRAVGTAFNIDANANNAVLSVTEGVVSVEPAALDAGSGRAPPGSALRVYAGQQLVLSEDSFRLSKMSPAGFLRPAWLEGRLEYRAEPLAFVMRIIVRENNLSN